jgi:vitamin B12 transporter
LKRTELIFFVCLLWANTSFFAQTLTDTIEIPVITIIDNYYHDNNYDNDLLDSVGYENQLSSSAETLLSRFSSVFSRSYGIGLYGSFSIRGSSSAQTAVKWNDFDINNSMLGISDLSVLALNSQINLQIVENDYSLGAIGGVVNFKSNNFKSKNGLSASINYNTLNNITLGASGNFRGNRFFHNFDARIQNNSNSFEYKAGSEVKSITNSSSEIYNLNYNSLFVRGNNILSFFSSYNLSARKIPPSRYESYSDAQQEDESIKTGIHFYKTLNSIYLKLRTGFFYDRIDYHNNKIGEDSASKIYSLETGVDIRKKSDRVFNPSLSLINKLNSINSTVYRVDFENTLYVTGGLDKTIEQLAIELKLSTGIFRTQLLPASPYLIFSYSLNDKNMIIFKTGRNFRVPSYNDRFWNKSVNFEIRPEKVFFVDLKHVFNNHNRFKTGISVYYKRVIDNIMWLPENGVWAAHNIDKSQAYGLDFETSVFFIISKLKLDLLGIYKYNKTTLSDEEKGIHNLKNVYFPVHIIQVHQRISGKRIFLMLSENYTGKVFTSFDSSELIDSWLKLDADLVYDITVKRFLFKTFLSFENILDMQYETIKNYPQPGRVASLGFKVQIAK